ncbi:efflux RND transporter periplasmic adaptor subunit [Martelella alba]|uniref:Efflux RND transporter periplasmic adaptor subunit n=1 Tax=Martelella alba TaxID=2590451 RepID=A0A506UID7_9HYPH|nr:efflux RND transporter periplasmic adaptor subunit [Martelella alba]TPW33058.1 efflux RND transporter periplasmic adaptor subunit [Martelella alba]
MSEVSGDENKPADEQPVSRPTPAMPDINAILGNNKASRKRHFPWKSATAIVIVLALGAGGYMALTRGGSIIPAPAIHYVTSDVKHGDLTVTVTATGSVEPTEQVDISSELSGTVRAVLADYNDTIKKGDVLLRLDTDELNADVLAAKARLAAANADVAGDQSDLEAKKTTLERTQRLAERNVAPRQDLEDAQFAVNAADAALQSAEAQVAVAQADVELAELRLSKADIVSPIDGIVLDRDVDVGQTVASSLEAPTLFVIAGDLQNMELQVDIDEADVGMVSVGQKADFTVAAYPGKSFPAEIRSIHYASSIQNDVVTYQAVLSVDNSDLLLRQGMTATANILVNQLNDVLLVPNAALRYVPQSQNGAAGSEPRVGLALLRPSTPLPAGQSATQASQTDSPAQSGNHRIVWILRNGEPMPINITIGSSDGTQTQVLDGDLRTGDLVITGSQP